MNSAAVVAVKMKLEVEFADYQHYCSSRRYHRQQYDAMDDGRKGSCLMHTLSSSNHFCSA